MDVLFATKKRIEGSYVMTGHTSQNVIYFTQGMFRTNDKTLIKELMKTPQFKKEEIVLLTDEDVVVKYLFDEDKQDYFTEELLNKVSDKGVELLGESYLIKAKDPKLVRLALVDSPISSLAEAIMEEYPYVVTEDPLELAIENGDIIYNKPWYKTKDGENIGKSKEDAYEYAKLKFGNK